jgi:predicted transcriptional regulator
MARRTSGTQALRNFHVPLPEDLYHALQVEAEQARRPANALAREAIAVWLDRQRQARIDQAILAYAEAVAGTPEDLDPDIETASLESLAQQV